jgi:hypothetical protein
VTPNNLPFNDAERAEFREMWNAGVTIPVMCKHFGRSDTSIKKWRDRLGCRPRRASNSGKAVCFDISEAQIYAEAEKLRERWPAWRTPGYAICTEKNQARIRRMAEKVSPLDEHGKIPRKRKAK